MITVGAISVAIFGPVGGLFGMIIGKKY